jgi:nitrite reductase (NADH) small subunit
MVWIRACSEEEVASRSILRQRLSSGERIGLARLPDGRVVAFENKCPHAGGPLAMGAVQGSEVICPWHFFRFDLLSGKPAAISESVMRLRLLPVDVKDGQVFVQSGLERSAADAE